MKKLIEEIMNHCDGIIERSERMTSGNYMHNCAANKFSAKIIKSCVNNLTNGGIHWQTGEPELTGNYLVTFKIGPIVLQARYVKDVGWETWEREKISAWCKLSDIKPYKEV